MIIMIIIAMYAYILIKYLCGGGDETERILTKKKNE